MTTTGYIKQHRKGEFIVKSFKRRGTTYYKVVDTYDMSMASLEDTQEAANKMAAELNKMRNNRLGL